MDLTREQIQAADDLPREKVFVEKWGGDVYVRAMTGTELDAFEEMTYSTNGKNVQINRRGFRARLVMLTVVDKDGNRMFSESDMDWLSKKGGQPLGVVVEVAKRLQGWNDKDVEELTKNSSSAPESDSGSGSPAN